MKHNLLGIPKGLIVLLMAFSSVNVAFSQKAASKPDLGSGTYTVTSTTSCILTATATASKDTICAGQSTTLTASSSTGVNVFTSYTWNPGNQTVRIITVSPATTTTYTVTINDSQTLCTGTSTVVITVNNLPTVSISPSINPVCKGSPTVLTAGGANTYSWGAPIGSTLNPVTVSPLSNATYTVTGTDSHGCSNTSTTAITVNSLPTITASANPNPVCKGTPTVLTAGGASTYNWNPGGPGNPITVTPLSNTTYTVTGTDANGCVNTTTALVTVNPLPTVSAGAASSFLCNGVGTVLVARGASTYSWNPGGPGNPITVNPGTDQTYTVTGTDANGCTNTATVSITVFNLPTVTASASINTLCKGSSTLLTGGGAVSYVWTPGPLASNPVSVTPPSTTTYTVTGTDSHNCHNTSTVLITVNNLPTIVASATNATFCKGGSTALSATGAGPTGTYLWNPGGLPGSPVTVIPSIATEYTVIGTDANGCTNKDSIAIDVYPLPTLTPTQKNPTCSTSNGSATVKVSGETNVKGFSSFIYNWSNGVNISTSSPKDSIIGITAGNYTVTVTDGNGCIGTTSYTLTTTPAVKDSLVINPATCGVLNGSISSIPSGGTGTFTYKWSNNGISQSINGLAAGGYTVTVTDQKGCTNVSAGVINNAGAATVKVSSPTNVMCFGSSTGADSILSVSGGTGAYTYSWSNGASGVTKVTGLPAGTYTVSVTDANHCLGFSTVTISQPTVLSPSTSFGNVNCFGGSTGTANVSVKGGTGAYTYSWSSGQSGVTGVTGLPAGIYTVSVTDANNCPASATVTINQPTAALALTPTSTNIKCFGNASGSAGAGAAGGTPNYSYAWSNLSSNASINNLVAATYTVTVTDANACSATTTILLTQPAAITPSIFATTQASCGGSNGSATASAGGGTSPYQYSWPSSVSQTDSTANGLSAGNYTVTVTDANSCTMTTSATITDKGAATLSVAGGQTICIGQTASLSATLSGGTNPFTYSWSGGLTGSNPTANPIVTTTYSISVVDALGCSTSMQTVTVIVNPPLTLSASSSSTGICNGANATLTASGIGGNGGPYTYSWAPGGNTGSQITVSPNGNVTYTVTVNDNCGTPVSTAVQSITVNPLPTVSFSSDINQGCGPSCVNFTGSPSAAGSSAKWKFGDNDSSSASSPQHCYNNAGAYTVSFTYVDVNGCSATSTVNNMININAKPKATFTYDPAPVVIEGNAVNFNNTTTGASSYYWNFNDPSSGSDNTSTLTSPTHTFKDSGKYCVILVAINNNCLDTTPMCLEVHEPCKLSDSIPNVFTPNADGINDLFTFKTSGLAQIKCTLFNRWGMEIYEYNAVHSGWDGRTFSDNIAPTGTYFYVLDATCNDGSKKEGHGYIQVLR